MVDNVASSAEEWIREFEKHGPENAASFSGMLLKRYGNSPELKHFRWLLDDYVRTGGFSVLEALIPIDHEEKLLSFEEWVHSEYHSGVIGSELFDLWKREIKLVVSPRHPIIEWGITGCIGGGKSYAAVVAMLYKGPYFCSCLRWPQSYLGLAQDTTIIFSMFNAILKNAQHVGFKYMADFVRGSKWFTNHCQAKISLASGRIDWTTKNLSLQIGSSEVHALGGNVLSYMIDEANFMKTPEGRSAQETQAYKIYNHATRRMKSRFLKMGVNPGFACIVSSRLSETSFLEDLIRDNKDNPTFHVTDLALWDAWGYGNYCSHHFRVAVGNKYRHSEVLDEVDTHGSANTKDWTIKEGTSKDVPKGMKITRIPADLYFECLKDIDGCLREAAGIATFGSSPLICRTESVWECIDASRKHPFTVQEATLSLDDPDSSLVSITQWKDLCHIVKGEWIPKYHPGVPRIVHVDLGLTGDAAAISMGCSYDVYSKSEFNPTTGQIQSEWCPKVWVDFMLRIVPVRGQQIDLGKIVTYIVNLRNYGFNLQRVTFDGFASEMAIQSVLKANLTPPRSSLKQRKSADEVVRVESYVVSVDKDDKPYRMLRDMLFHGDVSYYNYPPFVNEVLALEHDVSKTAGGVIKGKVDHPPKGTKDVADAVAGMVWGIATSKVSMPSGPVKESVGDPPRSDIESQLTSDIVRDYGPDVHRIAALVPTPIPTPPPRTARSHKIQTRSWHDDIGSGFGKHRP
jgi:hypothetical protein